jgi:hypothetical protein
MEYKNGLWLYLEQEGEEKAEKFSRNLYKLEIPSKEVWFDKLENSITRERQPEMTIEDFFSLRRKYSYISFVVGRTEILQEGWAETISLCWRTTTQPRNADYFYWFRCDYKEGLEKVDKAFKQVYKKNISNFPRLN